MSSLIEKSKCCLSFGYHYPFEFYWKIWMLYIHWILSLWYLPTSLESTLIKTRQLVSEWAWISTNYNGLFENLFCISFGALWTDITQANSAGSQTIETKKPENLSSWEWVDRPQSLFDSYLKKMNFTTKLDWLGVGHKLVNLHVNLTLRHLALLHQREREEVQKERWIWNYFKRSIRLSRIVLGTLPPYHFQNLN